MRKKIYTKEAQLLSRMEETQRENPKESKRNPKEPKKTFKKDDTNKLELSCLQKTASSWP